MCRRPQGNKKPIRVLIQMSRLRRRYLYSAVLHIEGDSAARREVQRVAV